MSSLKRWRPIPPPILLSTTSPCSNNYGRHLRLCSSMNCMGSLWMHACTRTYTCIVYKFSNAKCIYCIGIPYPANGTSIEWKAWQKLSWSAVSLVIPTFIQCTFCTYKYSVKEKTYELWGPEFLRCRIIWNLPTPSCQLWQRQWSHTFPPSLSFYSQCSK